MEFMLKNYLNEIHYIFLFNNILTIHCCDNNVHLFITIYINLCFQFYDCRIQTYSTDTIVNNFTM